MAVVLRDERPGDADAIREVTAVAFAPMSYSDGSEPAIIDRLRADGDLTISLVAEDVGEIVGHVALSPAAVEGAHDGWFGLGPISVLPGRQGQGIGRRLVEAGLAALRARGARGCVLIGDPALYGRFGFSADGALAYGALERRYVQWIAFEGPPPEGEIRFAPAFGDHA